jgi:hypothetical protein
MRTRLFIFYLMRTQTKCQKLFCFHGLPKLFVVLDSNCDLAFSIWEEKKVGEHLKTVCLHIPYVAIFLVFLRRSLES